MSDFDLRFLRSRLARALLTAIEQNDYFAISDIESEIAALDQQLAAIAKDEQKTEEASS